MLKVLLLLSYLCYSLAQVQGGFEVVADDGEFRALAVTTNNLEGSITVSGAKYTAGDDDKIDFSKKLEVAGFKFQAKKGSGLGQYYGAAAVDVDVDFSKDGVIGKVSAAVCEVAFGVSYICVYENYDSDPAFNYQMGNKLVCPHDGSNDCLLGCISVTDIDWTLIDCTQTSCYDENVPGSDPDCQIYNCTTQGTWTCTDLKCAKDGFPTYDVIEVFTVFSSQKVKYEDNKESGPDKAETSWYITVPYDAGIFEGIQADNSPVVVITYVAGKAASIEKTVVANNNGFAFNVNGKETFFAYDASATIDGSASTTETSTLDGNVIVKFSGSSGDPATEVICLVWKVLIGIWQGFGWSVQVIFFSWTVNQPAYIFYDPSFGQTTSTSAALGLTPGLMFPLLICIAHYLIRKL